MQLLKTELGILATINGEALGLVADGGQRGFAFWRYDLGRSHTGGRHRLDSRVQTGEFGFEASR